MSEQDNGVLTSLAGELQAVRLELEGIFSNARSSALIRARDASIEIAQQHANQEGCEVTLSRVIGQAMVKYPSDFSHFEAGEAEEARRFFTVASHLIPTEFSFKIELMKYACGLMSDGRDRFPRTSQFPRSIPPILCMSYRNDLKGRGRVAVRGEEEFEDLSEGQALRRLYERVIEYCTTNVLETPLLTIPYLPAPEQSATLHADSRRALDDMSRGWRVNLTLFEEGGGEGLRNALAYHARRIGAQSVVDVGAGAGFLLPFLTAYIPQVTAIERLGFGTDENSDIDKSAQFIAAARKQATVHLESRTLEEFTGEADVAVINTTEFFCNPEQVAQHLSRISRKGALISGRILTFDPLSHYVMTANPTWNTMGHEQSLHSYESQRWKRALQQHFRTVTPYQWNNTRIVYIAEK